LARYRPRRSEPEPCGRCATRNQRIRRASQ
jgi:hypothetical protein